MTSNRVLIVLVLVVAAMQGVILYRQNARSSATPPGGVPAPVSEAAANTTMDVSGLPSKGHPSAKAVLVEFSDYECPFCKKHAIGVGKDLDKQFVATGKLRVVFRNNPLAMHRNAKPLAIAAICAGQQGRYWDMHDRLFAATTTEIQNISAVAAELNLDKNHFEECTASPDPVDQISKDTTIVNELGLTGTPSFALGQIGSDGRLRVRKLLRGALPLDTFEKEIASLSQ